MARLLAATDRAWTMTLARWDLREEEVGTP
jgi:hypothetical protein